MPRSDDSTLCLQPAALCLLVLILSILSACDNDNGISDNHNSDTDITANADIIVIGAGIAGVVAALEASDSGKTVLILDMASIFGGHALLSAGGLALVDTPMQRAEGIEDSPELTYQDMLAWSDDIDKGWARRYVEASNAEIYSWLVDLGVKFEIIRRPPGNSVPRMHFPFTLGHGLMLPLIQKALQSDMIRFEFKQRADELILAEGKVIGVRTSNTRSGEERAFYGHAVLIATGGFQSNLNKVRQYWSQNLPVPERILAGSGVYSLGLGLDMATDVGAALHRTAYMWNYVTGVPDPRDPSGERGLRVHIEDGLPRADIWLNAEGERFVNECLSSKYSLPEILKQTGGNHWMLIDAKARPFVSVAGSGWTPEKVQREVFDNTELVKTANSLNDLAELMGVTVDKLQVSIERNNAHVQQGQDQDFQRFGENRDPRGGCAAGEAIDTPPYFAIKRYPLARKSMGGIVIDQAARVIDVQGNVIPGLYAAGEVTGFAGINGTAGLEGTFLGPSIYTGRIAARTIVAETSDLEPVSWRPTETNLPSETNSTSAGLDCEGCHPIAAQVSTERPGYKHFELAHRRVVELDLPCAACHADMAPYNPTAHTIDYLKLGSSCIVCHGSGGD